MDYYYDVNAYKRFTPLVYHIFTHYIINDRKMIEKIEFYAEHLVSSKDFLEFIAWTYEATDFKMNYLRDSSYGVVQQYRGLLDQEGINYVEQRSASWYGIDLRKLLSDICVRFP